MTTEGIKSIEVFRHDGHLLVRVAITGQLANKLHIGWHEQDHVLIANKHNWDGIPEGSDESPIYDKIIQNESSLKLHSEERLTSSMAVSLKQFLKPVVEQALADYAQKTIRPLQLTFLFSKKE